LYALTISPMPHSSQPQPSSSDLFKPLIKAIFM
jgi:hypothetical protein